jgi:hypothetical protein
MHHWRLHEMKQFILFFSIAMFVCGCSSSRAVRPTEYGILNEDLSGQLVELEIQGARIPAKNVTLSRDSISWVDPRTDRATRASIHGLNKIVKKNHPLGALEGLGLGVAIGGGVGALVGSALNIRSTAESGSQTAGFGALVGLVLGGGAGAIIGSVSGFAGGHSTNYEFPVDQVSDSTRNVK